MPVLETEVAKITPELMSRKWLQPGFYTKYGIDGHRLQAEQMYRALVRALNNISPLFLLSFCRHEETSQAFNHGLLSQWRGYAEGGGFAIEFDEAGLDSLIIAEATSFAYLQIRSDDVLYDGFDTVFKSEIYEGIAGELIFQVFNSVKIDVSSVSGHADMGKAVLELNRTAPFFKHWGFHEEKEYRIAAACQRSGKVAEDEKRPNKEIRFRKRNGLVTPYIDLFSSLPGTLPIKSIIVGPHPHQEKQADALKMALETKAVHAEVRLSAIPYRK